MKFKRFICFVSAILILISSCSGCGKGEKALVVKKFNADTPAESISTQTVASNDLYKLDWNDENKCLLLTELSTGKIWSNIPYEYLLAEGGSVNVNSTLNITVADAISLQLTDVRGFSEAVMNGRVFCEKIENGVRITYCFDKYEVSVPVEYVLRGDSLKVSIDTPEICEGSGYLLVSVSLAPFLCSARNSVNGSYLLVPTGSGALMYAKETPEIERTYSGEVYGMDITRPITEDIADDRNICLPVFGAKDGKNAIMGIIENGANSAELEAMSGNSNTGYSNIYPTFYYRGYDIFDKSAYKRMTDDLIRVSELVSKETFTVGYYSLSGNEADYNGMAKRYRKYLQDNGLLKSEKYASSPYSVTVSGGILTTSLVCGIPKKTLKTMTTFSQAKEIITDLVEQTKISPIVRLQGYGDSGVNYGKVGGGYAFPNKLGSNKDRASLEAACKESGTKLLYDFELIRYSKSGNSFSYISDSAKTAVYKAAQQHTIKTPLRNFNGYMPYRILGREQLKEASQALIKMATKKKLSGVSVTSLGSIAYSDYSDTSYISKGKITQDVKGMLDEMTKKNLTVATGPNAYAACAANLVFDVPTDNGAYNAFDEEIPFYAMVFRGSRPLYTNAINIEDNKDAAIMRAAIGGIGLGFSLIKDFDLSYMETDPGKLYGMVYEDNKSLIDTAVKKYDGFYKAVENTPIDRYERVSDKLSKTTFENGVVLYANHSDKVVKSPLGEITAYGYLWK